MVSYIVISAVCVLLLAADQIVKVLIDTNFKVGDEIVVIENFFSITNVHNTGAAWGSFSNATIALAVVSILMAGLLFFAFIQEKPALLKLATGLVIAGAIGNVIDRLRLLYVVDFLHFFNLFGFYDFPVFNIADICVTSGVIGMIIYLLFVSPKKEAFREGTILHKFFYTKSKKKNDGEAEAGEDESPAETADEGEKTNDPETQGEGEAPAGQDP